MTAPGPRRPSLHWRWVFDSPLLAATWLAVVLGLFAMLDVARALRHASSVRLEVGGVLAKIAAETAAMQLPSHGRLSVPERIQVADISVAVRRQGDEWFLASHMPDGRVEEFVCPILPGAAPSAFGKPVAAFDAASLPVVPAGEVLPIGERPQLDRAALARAVRALQMPELRRDGGVALLHWETGTERDDFVVDPGRARHGLGQHGELVVVPGHLWFEPRRDPLFVVLDHDLVVVVQGNLYVGCSIQVVGSGRLVFVAVPDADARPFADRDGNGRWSSGDLALGGGAFTGVAEGGGNVYLGLPGHRAALALDVGFVVGGELHLLAESHIDGCLVLPHGVTPIGSRPPVLRTTGSRSFLVERERVPGFATVGMPRPGLLRPHARAPATSAEQPLYLAAPAR